MKEQILAEKYLKRLRDSAQAISGVHWYAHAKDIEAALREMEEEAYRRSRIQGMNRKDEP